MGHRSCGVWEEGVYVTSFRRQWLPGRVLSFQQASQDPARVVTVKYVSFCSVTPLSWETGEGMFRAASASAGASWRLR